MALGFTEIALIVIAGLLFALEIVALAKPDDDKELITTVVKKWSREYPLIPFALGLLAGHFFW